MLTEVADGVWVGPEPTLQAKPGSGRKVGAYETALNRLDEAAGHIDVVVPGHGAVAEGRAVAVRRAADHAYIDAQILLMARGLQVGVTTSLQP